MCGVYLYEVCPYKVGRSCIDRYIPVPDVWYSMVCSSFMRAVIPIILYCVAIMVYNEVSSVS